MSCIDRETGAQCPGYPHQLSINTSDINGPGAVVGSRIYVNAWGVNVAQRAPGRGEALEPGGAREVIAAR